MTLALAFQDIVFDVVDRDGVPWLRASQIGLALGYGRSDDQTDDAGARRAIINLYNRHAGEFTESMTGMVRLFHQTNGAGQTREVRIFSPRGFHLLAMLSRTEVAKAFRAFALDLIEKYETPRRRPKLEFSPSEQAVLSGMPEGAKQVTIQEASLVARENPESLPAFLSAVLHLYLPVTATAVVTVDAPEPPLVSAFWDAWDELCKAGHIRNHSASPTLVAVNLPEFILAAREQGCYAFERAELIRLLPQSRRYRLLKGSKSLHSAVTGKTARCWVFQRMAS